MVDLVYVLLGGLAVVNNLDQDYLQLPGHDAAKPFDRRDDRVGRFLRVGLRVSYSRDLNPRSSPRCASKVHLRNSALWRPDDYEGFGSASGRTTLVDTLCITIDCGNDTWIGYEMAI
jgi:hypothetical protein